MLQAQVWWDLASPSKTNPNGLKFSFSKIDEANAPIGHVVRYRIYVPGVPESEKYSLGVWKIGTKVTDLQIIAPEVYVNSKGLLMTRRPRPDEEDKNAVASDSEIEAGLHSARGEPIRFILSNPKKTLLFTGTLVPHAVESKDGNCRLEARLGSEEGEAMLVYLEGASANSDIPFTSTSEGEVHADTLHTDANGHAVTVDLPYVTGKDAGTLKESISMKGCTVSVEIPWGKESYHPL